MPKNYYIILGIPSNSTQTDIKAAYRRLAKELHPDHYGESQTPFQVLQEAYSVLSDPQSRKAHDDSLRVGRKKPSQHAEPRSWGSRNHSSRYSKRYSEEIIEPLAPDEPHSFTRTSSDKSFHHSGSRLVVESIFDHFFGEYQGYHRPAPPPLEELTVEITLSPEEARRGGRIQFNIPIQMRCPSCYGYNHRYQHCRRCNGTGFLSQEKNVSVSYPAGITENHSIPLYLKLSSTEKIYLTALFKIR
ncbi:MAG: DnaJ domain-containing protein [Desulforhopalus sp.]